MGRSRRKWDAAHYRRYPFLRGTRLIQPTGHTGPILCSWFSPLDVRTSRRAFAGSVVVVPVALMLDPSAMMILTIVSVVIGVLDALSSRQVNRGGRRGDRDSEQDCCHSGGNMQETGHCVTYGFRSSDTENQYVLRVLVLGSSVTPYMSALHPFCERSRTSVLTLTSAVRARRACHRRTRRLSNCRTRQYLSVREASLF
jgi:hypothetical protein